MQAVKKKRKVVRRRLKKEAIYALVALLLFVYICFCIPGMLSKNKLKKLGYDTEAVTMIKEYKLTNTLLDNKWYSDQLNEAIKKKDFRLDRLELYLVCDNLDEDDFLLYDKLAKTYSDEALLSLFKELDFLEITPLLVYDPISEIDTYIQDVLSHRSSNTENTFVLSNQYIDYYKTTEEVEDSSLINLLVNKHYSLNEDYVPLDLVDMSVQYASKGIQMSEVAYESFKEMCNAMRAEGLLMYASSTYRSYSYQNELYESYVKRDGQELADAYAAKAGHSEHQTGLAADLATSNGGLSKFGETEEYQWLLQNAHKYGWILRYPAGKESITGYSSEPWHWRYVGSIATDVYQSKLTYDEYYMLYIQK